MEQPTKRPSWNDYFIEMAKLAATRATCPRRRVGCVLVKEHRLLATGYNGAVRGAPHCDDEGCLLVRNGDRESCVRAVHAELNALLQCAANGVSSEGCTLFCTDFPCASCAKAIVQAGVAEVVFLSPYPDGNSAAMLDAGGVRVRRAIADPDGHYRLETAAPSGLTAPATPAAPPTRPGSTTK